MTAISQARSDHRGLADHPGAPSAAWSHVAGSRGELAAALTAIERDRPRRATIVWRHRRVKEIIDLPEIRVPRGTVLILRIESGTPRFVAASGRVVFQARSVFGSHIEVRPGAQVHVVTTSDPSIAGLGRRVAIGIATGVPELAVTTEAGQQDSDNDFRLYRPPLRTKKPRRLASWRLPEVQTNQWGEPESWT